MRFVFAAIALLCAKICLAGHVDLPAETGAPVNEDDVSIPLHRCLRSSQAGAGVQDGAERCTVAFAIPLDAGRRVTQVRALYEDDDFNSQLRMEFLLRDTVAGGNTLVMVGKDYDPALTALEVMKIEPDYVLGVNDAAFVLVEVRGDTRLLSLGYDYD